MHISVQFPGFPNFKVTNLYNSNSKLVAILRAEVWKWGSMFPAAYVCPHLGTMMMAARCLSGGGTMVCNRRHRVPIDANSHIVVA